VGREEDWGREKCLKQEWIMSLLVVEDVEVMVQG
jgi:hypothetical protein